MAGPREGVQANVWVYAPPDQDVCVELPTPISGPVSVAFEGGATVAANAKNGIISFRLPARGLKRVQPPAELAAKAPRDWPGERPAIGIIDLKLGLVWTRISADDWFEAFRKSRLATELRVPVRRITTLEGLAAALEAGPTRWLAIVNPHGERFPAVEPAKWRDALDLIRGYVHRGGSWWETGGYSLYVAASPGAEQHAGPSGMGYLGLPVGGGDVDQPPERLRVTPEGRQWLGKKLADRVGRSMSTVNRGLARGRHDPGHVALVAGRRQDFIGGYRLGGWGWLWRVGGFWPNPDVALPVAVAAMEHVYTHPPLPVEGGGIRFLWHAVVAKGADR